MTNQQLAIQFFLQISVILVACRVMGEVIARLGQPKVVVMTMVTTLAAGPLFGWAWRAQAEVPDAPGVAVR